MSEEIKDTIETAAETAAETAKESMDDFAAELEASYKKIRVGDMVTGTVVSVSDTQVVLDLKSYVGGVIDKENLSNDPAFNMKEEIHPGDEITATVIKNDDGAGNLVLSRKEANDRLSWEKFAKLQADRTIFPVQITEIVKGGAVARVDGQRAFIPASRLAAGYVEDLETFKDQTIDVTVVEVDPIKKRLILSGREAARAKKAADKKSRISQCKVGTIMKGTVETLKDYGAFITLENGLSGLVHVSQISRKRVPNPAAVLKEGQEVTVKVIAIKDGKLSLSMRDLEEKEAPQEEIPSYHESGEATTSLADLFKGLKF